MKSYFYKALHLYFSVGNRPVFITFSYFGDSPKI